MITKVEKTSKRQHQQTTSLLENMNKNMSESIGTIKRLSDLAINININNTHALKVVKSEIVDMYDKYTTKVQYQQFKYNVFVLQVITGVQYV